MAANGSFSVAIVGGGVTGLAQAVSLHHRSIDVHVFEQSPALDQTDAGFVLNPSAIRALNLCHVSTSNEVDGIASNRATHPSAQHDQRFLFLDGFHPSSSPSDPVRLLYERIYPSETAIVNRKEFLQILSRKLPASCLHYSKCLTGISTQRDVTSGNNNIDDDDKDNKPLQLSFADGANVSADAVIGCDGVASKVRQIMLGPSHPSARPNYANQYSFRLQLSMDEAVSVVGPDRAAGNCVYLGLGKRFLTTPCADRASVQLSALCYDDGHWPAHRPTVGPATKAEVLSHFQDWVEPVQELIRRARPDVTRWAVFDQADNFPPTFAHGRIGLAGDAAHAMTPHLGTSLSAALGDVVVLTELFCDRRVHLPRHLAAALDAYSAIRHPHTQWLVQASRRAGFLYFWLTDEARSPEEDGRSHILALHEKAWNYEVNVAVGSAKQDLGALLRKNEAGGGALERRAGVSQRPFNEMLGMYDYYERARQSDP